MKQSRADFLRSELEFLTTDAIAEVNQMPRWDRVKFECMRLDDIALIRKELSEIEALEVAQVTP